MLHSRRAIALALSLLVAASLRCQSVPAGQLEALTIPRGESREAMTRFRSDLERLAQGALEIPFECEFSCGNVDPVRHHWTLTTDEVISDHLDKLGIPPLDNPLAQLVEWSRRTHTQLLTLTQAHVLETGIDPLFDADMDFELSVQAVTRSPEVLEPIDPETVTVGEIRRVLSRHDSERLHGGRLARVVFQGRDLVRASDGHDIVEQPRGIPVGSNLAVEIQLDSSQIAIGAPLRGRVVVTNTGTRRITASHGSLLAGLRITSADGADAPWSPSLGGPSLRDWANTIILLPGQSHTERIEIPTHSAPRQGYMLTAGTWTVGYSPFPEGPPHSAEVAPVTFHILTPGAHAPNAAR